MKKITAFITAIFILLTFLASCGTQENEAETYGSGTSAETDATAENVDFPTGEIAIKTENFSVSAEAFKYFFKERYQYIASYATYYYGLDTSVSLKEQECSLSEGESWYDYLIGMTESVVKQFLALCEDAKANGMEAGDEETAAVEEQITLLKESAEESGITVEEAMEQYFGSDVTEQALREALLVEMYAYNYLDNIIASADVSDEALETYYTENSETLGEKDTTHKRSVRHILFSNDTYTDDSKVNEVYNAWVENGATLEEFESLVTEYSEDTSSVSDGGLYDEIKSTDSYVEEFLNWTFDESRQPGDHGIIETEYGWHIMYFVEESELEVWQETVKEAIQNDAYTGTIDSATEKYTAEAFEDVLYAVGE